MHLCSAETFLTVSLRCGLVVFNSVDGGGFETFETTGIAIGVNRHANYFFVMCTGFIATATNC